MATPHNTAEKGQIAKFCLMPGDPLRAKMLAEKFLKNAKCFNQARGMLGYTGEYEGRQVSVMGSGMGMPSIGIYSYELFKFYGVESIVRIGSCGAYSDGCGLGDVFLVNESWTDSNFGMTFAGITEDTLRPSARLNDALKKAAVDNGVLMKEVKVKSSDAFYKAGAFDEKAQHAELMTIRNMSIAAVEMESYALFAVAKSLGKEASCLLSVSDVIGTNLEMSAEERQEKFTDMIKVGLSAAKYI